MTSRASERNLPSVRTRFALAAPCMNWYETRPTRPTGFEPRDLRFRGGRQVTDARLLTLARRNSVSLITVDSDVAEMAEPDQVTLLTR